MDPGNRNYTDKTYFTNSKYSKSTALSKHIWEPKQIIK